MSDTPAIPPAAFDAEGLLVGSASDPSPATPAATVVALRDGEEGAEVLLLRRRRGGSFGGLWVFPGGRVEADDAVLAGISAPDGVDPGHLAPEEEVTVARYAAVRESMEEAQLVLAPEDLEVYSYWLPPPEAGRRYSTWFFVARADAGASVVVDRSEVHEHRWLAPAAALAQRDAGALGLAPPTWMTLWQLSGHPDAASVLTEARSRPPLRFESHVFSDADGRVAIVWDGDSAYEDGDLGRPGPRRRLWMLTEAPWRVEVDPEGGPGGTDR